jgi:hypothetical protein
MEVQTKKYASTTARVSPKILATLKDIAKQERTTVSSYLKRIISADLQKRGYEIERTTKDGIDIA